MFWGLILKANKRYSQTVTKSFHLSQAALDTSTCTNSDDIQVLLTSDDKTYILCSLRKDLTQCLLNLNFTEGDKISFSSKGSGIVHLTGYLLEDEDMFMDDESDEEAPQLINSSSKPKKESLKKDEKSKQVQKNKPESDDEESDDDDFVLAEESDDDMNAAGTGDSDDDEDDDEEDDSDDSDDSDEADDKEVQKKAKIEQPPVQNGTDKPKNKKDKAQKQQPQQNQKNIKKQVLQGGVIAEDLKVGNGVEAKSGKKVQVYYEGRLKDTNKIFDSSKQGPGFKFNLGRGEVIRGWDIGVQGMKVGGKRRLICPAAMAYGQKGSPPAIPSNSTLVFDVELKKVF